MAQASWPEAMTGVRLVLPKARCNRLRAGARGACLGRALQTAFPRVIDASRRPDS